MDLRRRIAERHSEFLLFAVTPLQRSTSPERAQQIADATLDRLRPVALDGLVLYDIDDESDRNAEKRPFPFQATMDPADYLTRHLSAWTAPAVVYRAVGKYPEVDLRPWLRAQDPDRVCDVATSLSRDKAPTNTDKPTTRCPVRAQRRERVQPASRDRAGGATRRAAAAGTPPPTELTAQQA